jgi:hypothetical protein
LRIEQKIKAVGPELQNNYVHGDSEKSLLVSGRVTAMKGMIYNGE